MAHEAAVSLKLSLFQLYESYHNLTTTHFPTSNFHLLNQILNSILSFEFEESRLQEDYFEKEIGDALWKVEDIIESYTLSHLLSPQDTSETSRATSHSSNFSKDLLEAIQEIESIKERMDILADDLKNGKENFILISTDDFPPVHKNKMLGLDLELENMKNIILEEYNKDRYLELGAIVIHGMGGVGKTSLAISIYNDLDIRRHFSVGSWIKIFPQHSVRNILLSLFHTMEFFHDKETKDSVLIEEMDDEELANFIRTKFILHRYLVIVDCLCDINLSSWDYIKTILPDSMNGSRILLVSRSRLISDRKFIFRNYKKEFLHPSQSWNLLRQQVFGDEPCPSRTLEKIGERIAEKCQGLPLAIITVGIHLAKEEKNVEYWNKVVESGNSIAYEADGAPMFEQLGLSYKQMPQSFRPYFLYFGVFPERMEISPEELCMLSVAEGLLDLHPYKYFLERDLVIRIHKNMIERTRWSLHHALWHFCCNQAKKEAFFHVFEDKYTNEEEDSNTNRKLRRLVVRKTATFGIDEFVCKIEPFVRSMLFTGMYHPYPLKMILWGSYKMLKVLNACSIRFYEFPDEILHLRLLRYLAMTLNGGDLPSGISKLKNLMSMIVRFHHLVRSCQGVPSYLPIEIWEMQELRHLEVMGCDLPAPPSSDAMLPNLVSLFDVSPHSCTKEVLERIPNLMMLRVGIYAAPKRNSAPMFLFDQNVTFAKLDSASFLITNPYFEDDTEPQVVAMPESFSISMKNVQRLSFCGCGFPWESIEPISLLPFLETLELRSHAFRGPKWELTNRGFSRLRHLLLDELDLVYWTTTDGDHCFPCITMVVILKCHKLEILPLSFLHCRNLCSITVLESSYAAEIWAWYIHSERSQTMGLTVASQRGVSTGDF